jgi:hypothetical protein
MRVSISGVIAGFDQEWFSQICTCSRGGFVQVVDCTLRGFY